MQGTTAETIESTTSHARGLTKNEVKRRKFPVNSLINRELGAEPGSPCTASTASQSMLFMANAKDKHFSGVSGRLADAIFKQSIEIGNLAVEKGRFRPPVSGR